MLYHLIIEFVVWPLRVQLTSPITTLSTTNVNVRCSVDWINFSDVNDTVPLFQVLPELGLVVAASQCPVTVALATWTLASMTFTLAVAHT